MYTSGNNHSSKKSLHAHRINETAYSFADQFRQHPTPYEVNKKLSSQVTSYPLSYALNNPTRGFEQNTFNSGWSNELSKIQQLNSKISRTTEEILHSRHKSRVSEHDHHLLKQPEEKKKKYYRQFVRYEPTSLSRNNYGQEPIIIRRESKDNDSEDKRSRKSSVKINFMYENSPSRKNSFQSGIERVEKPEKDSLNTPRSSIFQSPASSNYLNADLNGYRSTQLILGHNKDLMRKSSLKKDVKFIYQSSNDHEEYNPNTRSAISTYEMAKYSPKVKERTSEGNYLRSLEKDPMIRMTGSSYLEENFGTRKSQQVDRLKQKERQKQKQKAFYQMQDYEFQEREESPMKNMSKTKQHKRDVFYDMQSPPKTKLQSFSFKQPTTRPQNPTPPPTIQPTISPISKTLSQMKDKQSRLIAIALIVLALIIFIMQLFS